MFSDKNPSAFRRNVMFDVATDVNRPVAMSPACMCVYMCVRIFSPFLFTSQAMTYLWNWGKSSVADIHMLGLRATSCAN